MSSRARGVGAVVVVVAGLVLLVTSLSNGSDDDTSPAKASETSQDEPALGLARDAEDDPMALGDEDAPVVMVEYADFRCPFCGIFARDTQPKLENYIDNGTLRLEWHDLPVFGKQSLNAAVAGRAAANQGRFWEFHTATFADAPERGHLDLPRTKLIALAKEAGVPDIEQFKTDLDSKQLRADVRADAQKARNIGATGTPLFLVNGEPIMGAQPLAVFERVIENQAGQ